MKRAVPAALLAGVALLSALPALAQQAPETAPVPETRALPEAEDAAAAAGGSDPDAAMEAAPASEPEEAAETETEELAEPPESAPDDAAPEAVPPEPPMPARLAEGDLDLGICLGRLAAFGTVFERAEEISDGDGACGIANPLRVTEIAPGVALSPAGVMRCATAAALAEWVARFVLPASAMLPERGLLAELTHGSVYICRRIGNADEGTLSEHAFGNAVDVMEFRFASGPPIPVQPREGEGTAAAAFQRTVRAAACLSFTTVLGPGVDDHDDHLHLDIASRESGSLYCP